MIVSNPAQAGQIITAPSGEEVVFDAVGRAECGDGCGLDLVPGYRVLHGTPTAVVTADNDVVAPDGPLVYIRCPVGQAGQPVGCPDGRTTVLFNEHGLGVGPNSCMLDQVGGYVFQGFAPEDHGLPVFRKPAPVTRQVPGAVDADFDTDFSDLTGPDPAALAEFEAALEAAQAAAQAAAATVPAPVEPVAEKPAEKPAEAEEPEQEAPAKKPGKKQAEAEAQAEAERAAAQAAK